MFDINLAKIEAEEKAKHELNLTSLNKINFPLECFISLKEEIKNARELNHNFIAEGLFSRLKIITFTDTDELYAFDVESGLYLPFEADLQRIIQYICEDRTKTHLVTEITASIKRQTRVGREIVGKEIQLIPMQNCIYNFKTKETLPYSKDHVFLSKHPTIFVKINEAQLPTQNPIDLFLEQICESDEDILLVKEIIGYCFYRGLPFQNFFIFVGKGANGKSVLLVIIREMLGSENVSNQSLQNLTENRFSLHNLYGKNANIFGDLPAKAFTDVGILKQITGGDEIEAEQKFKGCIKFRNYAKIIASCNEIPETPDMSDGFFRRPVILNFPNCFEGKENRNLTKELCTPENLSDFFNSCIDAFKLALDDNKFIRAEAISQKRDRYLNYSNSAIAFCQSKLEYDPDSKLPTEEIYLKYVEFCKVKKLPAKENAQFFQKLYRFFGNRAYKRRESDPFSDKEARRYIVVGVDWKEN